MDLLQFLISIIIIYSLAFLEYKIAKVYYTPFILIACPYSIIFTVQWCSIKIYNLTTFDTLYFPLMLEHLLIIWGVDMFFLNKIVKGGYSTIAITKDRLNKGNITYNLMVAANRNQRASKLIGTLGIFCSLYLLLSFVVKARSLSVIGQVVQEDFQLSYSGGLNFYLRLLCMIASAYFFSFFEKDRKRYLLFGVFCLIPNILTFVKGIIFICIVAGVLGNAIIHNRRINIKLITIIGLAGVIVFFGVYLIEICIWQPERFFERETYEYIFAKLNFYLISGVQGFNERLATNSNFVNSGENPVFASAVNLIAKLGGGERVNTISNIWTILGNITNYGTARTNTYSFIGILILYLGNALSILWELILAIMMMFFFSIMIQSKRIEAFINYILFASTFVLAWFDYYLMQTFWIYLVLILVVLSIASRCFRIKVLIGNRKRV